MLIICRYMPAIFVAVSLIVFLRRLRYFVFPRAFSLRHCAAERYSLFFFFFFSAFYWPAAYFVISMLCRRVITAFASHAFMPFRAAPPLYLRRADATCALDYAMLMIFLRLIDAITLHAAYISLSARAAISPIIFFSLLLLLICLRLIYASPRLLLRRRLRLFSRFRRDAIIFRFRHTLTLYAYAAL